MTLLAKSIVILMAFFWIGFSALSQDEGPYFPNTIVPRYGRLFSIDYKPTPKQFKVSLVGYPLKGISAANYDVTAEAIDANGMARALNVMTTSEGTYQFKDAIPQKSNIRIKVQDKKTKESEIFMLKP
ncbi:MAG: hypothetical protein J7501_07090 [Bdellovibrio sp.]|nr:hypothetical protein [Bdellovibrio sp.]